MTDNTFDLNLFIKESKEVLVNPKAYFSTMKTSGGMTEPLVKAAIYGAISGALAFISSLLNIGTYTHGLFGGATGIRAFVWGIIGAIMGLFIIAVILLVVSSICKGDTDFDANMRVTAAGLVIMPVSAFFGFASHFSFYSGTIISLAIKIFAIWLFYNGLVHALKTNPETTKIVSYVLIALFVVFTLADWAFFR